jgi:hypothetical protein
LIYFRKTKRQLGYLLLLPLILLGYQNCGSFATDPLLQLSSASSGSVGGNGIAFDAPYIDGLAAGTSQPGSLFARDPSSTSSNDRLSFTTALSPYVVQTTIKHLDSSKTYLSDPYISVNSDDFYAGSYADPNSSLVFPQDEQRFQQVNAFYHTDRLIADLMGQSLFPGASYTPIKVKSHCAQASNAFFDTSARVLCLGYVSINGTKVWAADDTDVVTHEFGHSLNHLYSTDAILGSTMEMGAMDEAFADLWAYRNSGDPRVSVWFGRAITSPGGSGAYSGLRNLDVVKHYPADVAPEVHDDSLFISAVVKSFEVSAGMNTSTLAKFEKHLLESLQLGHGFGDVIQILQDEAVTYGVSPSVVTNALNDRGLYRKDLASEISLDVAKPVYVIDNHGDSSHQVGGNCNGNLDSGETVILFPNVRNSGAVKGGVTMNLVSNTAGVTVLSGGDYGFLYRIPASTTYLEGEMGGLTPRNLSAGDYSDRLVQGAFYVRAAAGVTGAASLTLNIKTMNTIDGVAQIRALPISLNVGSVPTASSCTAGAEAGVYP